MQLVWLLDLLGSHPEIVAKLKVRLADLDLLMVRPEPLAKWKLPAIDVTESEIKTARMAWQAGLDDELRTLDREEYRARHEAYRRSLLSLTDLDWAIVAHKEDFGRYNPIDRWWAGTRLTNDSLWRRNPALVAPQPSRA